MKKIFLLLTLIVIGSCNKEDSIIIKQDTKYIEVPSTPKIIKPKKKRFPENKDSFDLSVTIPADVTTKQLNVDYTGDFLTQGQINIQSYDVYINNDFYGTDVRLIQVNTNDVLRFEIVKKTDGEEASLQYGIKLL